MLRIFCDKRMLTSISTLTQTYRGLSKNLFYVLSNRNDYASSTLIGRLQTHTEPSVLHEYICTWTYTHTHIRIRVPNASLFTLKRSKYYCIYLSDWLVISCGPIRTPSAISQSVTKTNSHFVLMSARFIILLLCTLPPRMLQYSKSMTSYLVDIANKYKRETLIYSNLNCTALC